MPLKAVAPSLIPDALPAVTVPSEDDSVVKVSKGGISTRSALVSTVTGSPTRDADWSNLASAPRYVVGHAMQMHLGQHD